MGVELPKVELPKLPERLNQEQLLELLDRLYDAATNGLPGQKSCEAVAKEYLDRHEDTELAVKRFTKNQAVVCATSGFLTNIGGLITIPLAVPANLSSVLYVQLRMIAVIATMGGYDVRDDAVQTLVYVCLAGMSVADILKDVGVQFGNKLAVNAVRKIPGAALTKINQRIGFRLITKFGEKGLINLGKVVPVAGGAIGGGVDWVGTYAISRRAYKAFVLETID